jgi:hypothetical protein
MIQITAQMRVLVAIEPVDGRKYAPSIDMRSFSKPRLRDSSSASAGTIALTGRTPHNVAFRMAARNGGRERTTWKFLNFCRNPMT